MPSEHHTALVRLGEKWLHQNGFGVVSTELTAAGSRERADVIGFRSLCSALIEVKVSRRRDFLADAKKPERISGIGLGVYRFYLSPPDVIAVEDLPPKWGLLHAIGGKVIDVVRPKGNIWPGYSAKEGRNWRRFQHRADQAAERRVLYSIARRLAQERKGI